MLHIFLMPAQELTSGDCSRVKEKKKNFLNLFSFNPLIKQQHYCECNVIIEFNTVMFYVILITSDGMVVMSFLYSLQHFSIKYHNFFVLMRVT